MSGNSINAFALCALFGCHDPWKQKSSMLSSGELINQQTDSHAPVFTVRHVLIQQNTLWLK